MENKQREKVKLKARVDDLQKDEASNNREIQKK